MVTRVQVGSLTSQTGVPGLTEITKEATLKRTYFCQTEDSPGAPSARHLEGKSPFRSPGHLFPLPRLAPKPFSKEKAPDVSLRPGLSRPSSSGGPCEGVGAQAVDARMSMLVGQEGPRSSALFHKATFLRPSPSAMARCETSPTRPTLGKERAAGSQELPAGSPPEVAAKPALPPRKPMGALPRSTPQSEETRPAVTPEARGPKEPLWKASSVEEARPRLNRRPLSAIFLESAQGGAVLLGRPPPASPEKTWARKPRPLSVELTAPFESRGGLLHKVASGGNGTPVGPASWNRGTDRPILEASTDIGTRSAKAESPLREEGSDFLEVTPRTRDQKERMLFKAVETGTPRTPGGSAQVVPKDNQELFREKAKLDREPKEAPESPSPGPGKDREPTGSQSQVANGVTLERGHGPSRGRIKKHSSSLSEEESTLALAVGSAVPLAPPETPSAPPEPMRGGLSVQKQIKGWGAESVEAKPEARRSVFPVRPLSVDLTKLFSSAASSHDVQYEKCPEPSTEPPKDSRAQKEGHNVDESSAPRTPRKQGPLREKAGQPEQRDGSNQGPNGCPLGGTVAVESLCTGGITVEDGGSFQKVWATMFEHHVERHSVGGQARCCPSATVLGDAPDTHATGGRPKPDRGSWLGTVSPGKTTPKKDNAGQLERPKVEKLGRTDLSNSKLTRDLPEQSPQGERCNNTFCKPLENLPTSQRVEPRLDVAHTVGERAHSEAVPTAPEEKAVSLRRGTGHLVLERRLSLQVPPVAPEGSVEGPPVSVQRATLIWEARSTHGATGLRPDVRESKDAHRQSCSPPKCTEGVSVICNNAALLGSEEGASARACLPEASTVRVAKASVHEVQPRGQEGTRNQLGSDCVSREESGPPRGCPRDPPSWAQDKLFDIPAKAGPGSSPLQKGPLITATGNSSSDPRDLEARVQKTSNSDQRMERWRRRTLPHDVKFEEFSFLASEPSTKGGPRQAGSVASKAGALRNPPLSHDGLSAQDVSPGMSAGQTLPLGKPRSPVEPKATFFAVTYQIPDDHKAKSVVKPGLENVTDYPSKAPRPLSSHPVVSTSASLHHQEHREPLGSEKWTKGRQSESAGLSKNWKPGERRPPPLGDKVPDPSIIDVDAFRLYQGSAGGATGFQNDRKDGGNELASSDTLQTTPAFQRHSKAGHLVRRKTVVVSETFLGQIKDGYRSTVLDIDALMAEYREQAARGPGEVQEREEKPVADVSSSSPWSRGHRGGLERGEKSPKGTPQTERVWQQARLTERDHNPIKQPADSLDWAPNTKFSPPLWSLPDPAPETPIRTLPKPGAPRKRATGISGEKKVFASRHHSTTCPSHPADSKASGQNELVRGPKELARSPPADRKRGTLRRSVGRGDEGNSGAQWRDPQRTSRRSPLDVKRAFSEKGAPTQIQEGLCILEAARERRREEMEERPGGPRGSLKAQETRVEPWKREAGTQGGHKDQLKQCFSRRPPEAKDTDTLVQEADTRYGTWTEQCQSGESLAPESPSPDSSATSTWKQPPSSHLSSLSSQTEAPSARDLNDGSRGQQSTSVDHSSTDLDSTDGQERPSLLDTCPPQRVDDFSFIDHTSVLDSSVLKTRVQLSKRSRRRAPISHSLRRSRLSESESRSPLEEEVDSTWMFKDSTEEKSPRRDEEEEEEEEEEPPRTEKTSVSHLQRMPAFLGMDPAVLKAQLHKRQEVDSTGKSLPCTPQLKMPKSPFQPGVLGSRVLPSSADKDERLEEASLQWLKELKSKKRQSLYENQA
ncbi:uncharacterized protein KIAA1671 homolog isoform X1 [Echinops telfairi]|uniref:Uncharacterized protein KIAA1671 homolog isoform X1 n=2 Tax=Echinops telfairi TaxID=9371 RepID=A0AC55D679_ECHTE|nr:uncharacterized protein KIAA1671 homolog isoform X1 [Echinops telfairi]